MITVRFPTGVAVTYNKATYLQYGNGAWKLHTRDPDKGGELVAVIMLSSGAMVDWAPPCVVCNDAEPTKGKALQRVVENLREYGGQPLAELKHKLKAFDSRSCQWRD